MTTYDPKLVPPDMEAFREARTFKVTPVEVSGAVAFSHTLQGTASAAAGQHAKALEKALEGVFRETGLWDGDESTKVEAAQLHAHRFETATFFDRPLYAEVSFDKVRIGTVETAVEDRCIVTRVKP